MTSTPENQGPNQDDLGQDPTRPIEVEPSPQTTDDTTASAASTEPTEVVEEDPLAAFGGEPPSPHTPVAAYEPAQDRQPTPERPTGPHLPPILLGVICLAVAGLALWQELADVEVDWGNVGPLGIAAIGALLVVLGLVGLLGSRRREASRSS